MSYNSTFGYNSLVGNCFSTCPPTTPGAPFNSVQFNDSGDFAGDSTFLFDPNTTTLSVPTIQPTSIKDNTNSTGTVGQVLTSTGTGIQFQNQVVPGAPVNSVQFNNSGTFGGDSNFIFNPATDVLNVNGSVGIGSLTTPTDRLVVTAPNSVLRIKSSTTNVGAMVIEDSSGAPGVKQFSMALTSDAGDFTSIRQGDAFKNFRFNSAFNFGDNCISINTTMTRAKGGFQCSNGLSNRKIILNSQADNDHQNYSLGINPSTFRFQIPDDLPTTNFSWNAGTGIGSSIEIMKLDGSGRLTAQRLVDGSSSTGTSGQVLTSTGTGLLWDELTPRFFFDTNATFQGTSGHRIWVSVQKKGTLYSVDVSMQRDGGIHFDLISPALTVGTQIIAILPVGWRPPASVDGIGYASNNNSWATPAFNWGSLNIDTNGNIRMRSPAAGGPITTIQPNLEQITCRIFWLSSGTVYNSDGITR